MTTAETAGARYVCCDERRRAALAASAPAGVSGIDYIEVRQGATVADPTEIDIMLVTPLPLPVAALSRDNIRLTGGVRFPAPAVADVVELPAGGGSVATYRVTIPGGQPTDFSTYRLAVVSGAGAVDPPAFLDARLSAVDFSFKVDCAEGDCAPDCRTLPETPPPEPVFDYRAREWEDFRRLMLDRLAVLVPGFRSDDPVDLTTTLVEALAYRADQQSYRLDWVGTEAFLDTARSRTSMTRHARLVDYRPGAGSSARTWVALTFAANPGAGFPDGVALPAHTPVLPRAADLPTVVPATRYAALLPAGPVVFTTLAPCPLWTWRSAIPVHTWSDEECVLPRGATQVTLVDGSVAGAGALAVGDLLLLHEVASPRTGEAADADPTRRHIVRLTRVTAPVTDVLSPDALVDVAWGASDALPFDLVVSALVEQTAGPPRRVTCAAAQGNVVLAEHGADLPPPPHLALPATTVTALTPRLDPPAPEAGVRWRPRLTGGPSTGPLPPPARVAAHGPGDVPALSAQQLVAVDPAGCLPAVTLQDAFAAWTVRADLLASGRFAREFVVESDATGAHTLRFGDDTHGQAPATGAAVGISGRFGTGTAGNLGHGALGHVVLPDVDAATPIGGVANPLAAVGGTEPESIAAVRVAAPQAYRVQERAVTAADYVTAALRFPGVANAVAVPRWTGSWQTVVIYLDRVGGVAVDAPFRVGLLAHLERYRLAGFDVAVRAARAAPLDVTLAVCAAPGRLRSVVGRQVREALSPFGGGGVPGFFHPDRFTFGTPLYLSALLAAVMAVPGVQSVEPVVFQRFGRAARAEIALGVIRPAATEVLELADDPDFPERGRLRIVMGGGR